MGGKGSGKHGNQGRKKSWEEETTTISFRWPASFVERLKKLDSRAVYEILKKHIK